MANEILVSGIGDLITQETMSAEYLMLLAERGDIFGHPALVYAGAAVGSNVVRVPAAGLMGYDLLSAGTPGSALANTALTDASFDVTVAWYGKSYEAVDLARIVADGRLDPELFALDMAVSVAQTLMNLIANLADGFTNVVGSTGVDMTIGDWVDGITTLEISNAGGEFLGLLHPRQWGDMRTAALALGGAAQYREDAQGVVAAKMGSYKGKLFGVDAFTSSRCKLVNTGADRAGMMFGRGAVLWADAEFPDEGDPNQLVMGRAMLERDRDGKKGSTAYVSHANLGAAEGIDLAGVSIVTDA